jgi:hypothetical protein
MARLISLPKMSKKTRMTIKSKSHKRNRDLSHSKRTKMIALNLLKPRTNKIRTTTLMIKKTTPVKNKTMTSMSWIPPLSNPPRSPAKTSM